MPLSVIFFGTPDFSVPSLRALCLDDRFWVKLAVTQPDKPAGRGREKRSSAVKALAAEHHIPILQPDSIRKNTAEFLQDAKQFGPFDIGVVIAFGQILPLRALSLPEHGCINIHASLLPRWRGAAPMQHAIMAGDKETGVCLMRMEEGLDSGPVYSELTTPIQESENFGALHDRLSQLAAELCRRDLIAVSQGSLTPKTQDQSLVTLAPKIDGEKCRIDWNKGADQIARLVRALSPAPAAFTYLDGARIKIFKAAVKSRLPQDRELPSGAVCHADSSSLEVCCGDENLSIEELQIEGRKRLPAAEFLKGSPLSRGQILR